MGFVTSEEEEHPTGKQWKIEAELKDPNSGFKVSSEIVLNEATYGNKQKEGGREEEKAVIKNRTFKGYVRNL